MTMSLNEIESTSKKAARGAGYSWGLAEEAGKAVRWLCGRDIDGCAALAALLNEVDAEELLDWSPQETGGEWRARKETLCPLCAGAVLSDHAEALQTATVCFNAVTQPVLMVPFAAMVAQQNDLTVRLVWSDVEATTDGDNVELTGAPPDRATQVTVSSGGGVRSPNRRRSRGEPAPEVWSALNQYAHRTYAPATEESRRKGAGASSLDNA